MPLNQINPFGGAGMGAGGGMKPLNQAPDRMQNMQQMAAGTDNGEMQPSQFMNQLRGGVETQRAAMQAMIQRMEKQLAVLKQQFAQQFGGMY